MVERRMHPHHFFNQEEKDKIVRAIRAAEKDTSGHIRIHLDCKTRGHVMDRAKRIFQRQRLHQRKDKNAVLIYLSLKARSFSILGDAGIQRCVGDSFWKEISVSLENHFSRGDFLAGLEHAIHKIGEKLKEHFALPPPAPPEKPQKFPNID